MRKNPIYQRLATAILVSSSAITGCTRDTESPKNGTSLPSLPRQLFMPKNVSSIRFTPTSAQIRPQGPRLVFNLPPNTRPEDFLAEFRTHMEGLGWSPTTYLVRFPGTPSGSMRGWTVAKDKGLPEGRLWQEDWTNGQEFLQLLLASNPEKTLTAVNEFLIVGEDARNLLKRYAELYPNEFKSPGSTKSASE